MKRQLNSGGKAQAAKRSALMACGLALALTAPLASAAPAAAAPKAASGANPVPDIRFLKSDFVSTPGPGFGKDPFFPKSIRTRPIAVINPVDTTPSFGWLNLKGVSGSKGHRLAIINNKTFEVGEDAELKTPTGQIAKVKVVEIRDDGVTVSIGGQTQKLYLGPKL
jgi:hypothetical protein